RIPRTVRPAGDRRQRAARRDLRRRVRARLRQRHPGRSGRWQREREGTGGQGVNRRRFRDGTATQLLAVVAALAAPSACAKKAPPPKGPPPRPALCSMEAKPAPDKSPLKAWNFTPQEWFNFLVMGYHASGDVARPVRDCTGQLVKLEADGCADDP